MDSASVPVFLFCALPRPPLKKALPGNRWAGTWRNKRLAIQHGRKQRARDARRRKAAKHAGLPAYAAHKRIGSAHAGENGRHGAGGGCGPGEKDGERGQAKAEQTRGDGAEGERPFAGKRGTAPHTGAVLAEGNGGRAKRAAFAGLQLLRRLMRGGNGCGFPARPNAGVLAIVLWLRAFLPEMRRYAAALCKRLPVPNPRQGPARRCRLAMPFLRKRQGKETE